MDYTYDTVALAVYLLLLVGICVFALIGALRFNTHRRGFLLIGVTTGVAAALFGYLLPYREQGLIRAILVMSDDQFARWLEIGNLF